MGLIGHPAMNSAAQTFLSRVRSLRLIKHHVIHMYEVQLIEHNMALMSEMNEGGKIRPIHFQIEVLFG